MAHKKQMKMNACDAQVAEAHMTCHTKLDRKARITAAYQMKVTHMDHNQMV